MGAKQSVQIESATEAQKERVGVFALRSTQRHTLEALSKLLDTILAENSLFNLSAMVSNPDRCAELFVVLSSTLKDKFKILRLPDPNKAGDVRAVSYISKDQYKELEKDSATQKLCNDIAWFMIRLVTLIVALTSSLSLNPSIPSLLDTQTGTSVASTMNFRYKDPQLPVDIDMKLKARDDPISLSVLDVLRAGGQTTMVMLPGTATEDSRKLMYLNNRESVIVDTKRRIVYEPLKSAKTRVMSIQIDPPQEYAAQGTIQQAYPQRQAFAPVPVAPAAAPAAAPVAPAVPAVPTNFKPGGLVGYRKNGTESVKSNVSLPSTITASANSRPSELMGVRGPVSRKNRKSARKSTRKSRKMFGGAKFFLVHVQNLIDCPATGCEKQQFYMADNGQTYDAENFEKLRTSVGAAIASMTFADRITKIMDEFKLNDVPLQDAVESKATLPSTFKDLFTMSTKQLSAKTFELFANVKTAITGLPEGASPAQYRAFLLASNLTTLSAGDSPVEYLQTRFCKDKWDGKRATDSVSYALLNALYFDRAEGGMETLTASECISTMNSFLSVNILKKYVSPGSTIDSFENTAFESRPKQLASYCEQPSEQTRNSTDKAILRSAHTALRQLYDTHMEKVVPLIRKVLIPKNAGYGVQPKLVLSDIFTTDARGALVVLEEIIKEARALLSNHYLAVEKVYRGALNQLKESRMGTLNETSVSQRISKNGSTKNSE
jgi:hypothetical protein